MATRSKAGAGADEAGATPSTPRRSRPNGRQAEVLSALFSGLEEVLPGIQVLDRELVFENGGRADLAAVDPSGRLVLVLLASEDGDRAVLETLDTYHYARTNTAILARHLSGRRINALVVPRIVVINANNDTTLVEDATLAPAHEDPVGTIPERECRTERPARGNRTVRANVVDCCDDLRRPGQYSAVRRERLRVFEIVGDVDGDDRAAKAGRGERAN